MSTRTQAINGLVQGTGLYQALDKRKRKTLVAMLDRAYRMGENNAKGTIVASIANQNPDHGDYSADGVLELLGVE